MKRTFACVGFTALISMCALTQISFQAVKAVFITAFVAFFICIFIKRIRRHGALSVVAFTVCLCCLVFGFYEKSVSKKTEFFTEKHEVHRISGEIVSLPAKDNGRVYYTVKTEEIDGEPNAQKIRLSFKEKLNASPFDRLDGNFRLYKLGEFSSEVENYYSSKGLFLGGYTNSTESIDITGRIGFHPMYYVLSAKQFVVDSIAENVPNEYGGLLTGFLLGEKGAVSEKTLNAFSLIGSYHLLAVSGLHITVWTGFVYSLLRALKLKRKLCNLLPILFILFFMALTGFNPPVVRAGILMIFVFAGRLFDKEADSINSIGFAVTLLVLINPYSALSQGLWLSVFAASGIIIASGRIYDFLNKKESGDGVFGTIRDFILKSLAVSLSVTLFTFPLTIIFFDRFSLITPVANLLLIEISSFAMLAAGFAVVFFALNIRFVSMPLFFVSSFLAKFISKLASALSELPYITLGTDYLPLRIIAVIIPFVVIAVYYLKKKDKKRLVRIICFAFAVVFLTACITGTVTERKRVRIYIPYVGDGMSVAVVDKNSAAIIGCGGNFFSYSTVCDIMKKEGVSKLDFVFVPTTEKYVFSFFDDICSGFETGVIKEFQSGRAEFNGSTEIDCQKDYAFINCRGTTVLAVLNPYFDFGFLPAEYLSADYLITGNNRSPDFSENNFGHILITGSGKSEGKLTYTSGRTFYLEVEQNGRTGLKTAD